ncbi:MAG TPA: acyltransferase [Gemmatimonadaceae bacterium]|jgi:carbonic anhydrase/acetyltransferase-like protein (isoleucine patch superfamily)
MLFAKSKRRAAGVDGGPVVDDRARHWLSSAERIGDRLRLRGQPHIENAGRITIGDDFSLSSTPIQTHLVTGPKGWLEIGSHVTIAHGAGLTAHRHIRIEDGAYVGPFCMIMDTDFHEAGDHGNAGEARPILIEAGAMIGARTTILRGAKIGAGARVAPNSVVSGSIAPGAVVAGNPARPLNEMQSESIAGIDRILQTVQRTLGLRALPLPTDGPHTLEQWDSLGALNLLLSLEEAFGVTIEPKKMLGVKTIEDFVVILGVAN